MKKDEVCYLSSTDLHHQLRLPFHHPDFSPRPRFSFHRDKLGKFLLYLHLLPSLPLVVDRGIQQLSRGGNVCENATSPVSSKRKREDVHFFETFPPSSWLSSRSLRVGLIGGNRSFGNFLDGFLRQVYLRDCLWGKLCDSSWLAGFIKRIIEGVGVFVCSIFLYWFIGVDWRGGEFLSLLLERFFIN